MQNQKVVIRGVEYTVRNGEVVYGKEALVIDGKPTECPICGRSLKMLEYKQLKNGWYYAELYCESCNIKFVQNTSPTTVILTKYRRLGYSIDTYYERYELLSSGKPCPSCGSPVKFLHSVSVEGETTYYHVCDTCKTIWKWNSRDAWTFRGARG